MPSSSARLTCAWRDQKSIDTEAARKDDAGCARRSTPPPIIEGLRHLQMSSWVPFKNRDGSEMKKPEAPARCATDKVRFVGDPIAFVVAETLIAGKGRRGSRRRSISTPLPAVSELASDAAKRTRRSFMTMCRSNVDTRLSFRRQRESECRLRLQERRRMVKLNYRCAIAAPCGQCRWSRAPAIGGL